MSLATLKAKVEQLIAKAQAGGEDTLDKFLTRSITHARSEAVTDFFRASLFADQISLVSVDFPNLVRTNDGTFNNCTKLEHVNVPKANYVGANAYENCISLKKLNFPSSSIVYTRAFYGASNLETIAFGVTTNFARTNAFNGCSSFNTLILRGNEISTLSNTNNFDDAGAFAEGASGGIIYVPSALIESYKTATNWSALYNAGRCNFVAIEGSEYE